MKKTIVLLMIVGAVMLAVAAYADTPIYIATADYSKLGVGPTLDGFTYAGSNLFTSTTGGGGVLVYSYYVNQTEAEPEGARTLWDYVAVNNTTNPTAAISSFTIDYTGSGQSITDLDDIASDHGWGFSTTGTLLKYSTPETGGNPIVAGGVPTGVGQFNVETAQLPIKVNTLHASAQDGTAYSGYVTGPAPSVPEPMSILLGCLGMISVGGFRRLRTK